MFSRHQTTPVPASKPQFDMRGAAGNTSTRRMLLPPPDHAYPARRNRHTQQAMV